MHNPYCTSNRRSAPESGDCRSAPEKGFAEYPDLPREVEGTKPIAKRNMYD